MSLDFPIPATLDDERGRSRLAWSTKAWRELSSSSRPTVSMAIHLGTMVGGSKDASLNPLALALRGGVVVTRESD